MSAIPRPSPATKAHARDRPPASAERSGAQIIWESLAREGVEVVYGYPGGAILPTYDVMDQFPQIHHVLTRHEQGATHMADGYARATGRVGVVMATSGPGATNLVTGIATAKMDSSPMVCITGQVPREVMGTDAFQETDVTGITLPLTKNNYLVTEVGALADTLQEAFYLARSGRPGPVLVDIPKDVQLATTARTLPSAPPRLRGYRDTPPPAEDDLRHALALLAEAGRPLILAGQGVLISGASASLRTFAEAWDIPVALTLLGKGGFPEEHPLCLGMMGMHGTATANHAVQGADLLLALGMRFDDRVTGRLSTYAPRARKIHVDIDPAEIGKNVAVDLGVVADLGSFLAAINQRGTGARHPGWRERIADWRREDGGRDILRRPGREEHLPAARAIHLLWQHTGGDALSVTDVGQHQMWEAQYYPHQRPRTLITSGGLGTMGFALPAAIGAKMGRPKEEVWAIVGDGGFQMTMPELATAVQEGVEIKIAIINNGYLGMVRQWQELFHGERYHSTPLAQPDFCRLAAAFGVPARRVRRSEELGPAVDAAKAHRGGPFLIEIQVAQHDLVYPMVPAGSDLDAMLRRPLSTEGPSS